MTLSYEIDRNNGPLVHTGDTAYQVACTIDAGDLVVGGKYLLMARLIINGSSVGDRYEAAVLSDGVQVSWSFHRMEPVSSGGNGGSNTYSYVHVYEVPNPAETITLVYRIQTASATSVWVDFCNLLMIRLDDSDLVEGVDYLYDEDTVLDDLTTSWQDYASITWTPTEPGDWLVLGNANWNVNAATSNTLFRVRLDGTTAVPDDTSPTNSEEGEDVLEELNRSVVWPITALSAASHDLVAQMRDDSSSSTDQKRRTFVFALRLGALADVEFVYTVGSIVPAVAPAWTELATVTLTPSAPGDYLVVAAAVLDMALASLRSGYERVQNDGVDIISGMGGKFDIQATDSSDVRSGFIFDIVTIGDTDPHVFDLDGSVNQAVSPVFKERALVIGSLAEGAPAGAGVLESSQLPLMGAGRG